MKLTPKQREILERQGVEGTVVRYEARWVMDGRIVTATVNRLLQMGLLTRMDFRDNKCSAWITDAGSAALKGDE